MSVILSSGSTRTRVRSQHIGAGWEAYEGPSSQSLSKTLNVPTRECFQACCAPAADPMTGGRGYSSGSQALQRQLRRPLTPVAEEDENEHRFVNSHVTEESSFSSSEGSLDNAYVFEYGGAVDSFSSLSLQTQELEIKVEGIERRRACLAHNMQKLSSMLAATADLFEEITEEFLDLQEHVREIGIVFEGPAQSCQ